MIFKLSSLWIWRSTCKPPSQKRKNRSSELLQICGSSFLSFYRRPQRKHDVCVRVCVWSALTLVRTKQQHTQTSSIVFIVNIPEIMTFCDICVFWTLGFSVLLMGTSIGRLLVKVKLNLEATEFHIQAVSGIQIFWLSITAGIYWQITQFPKCRINIPKHRTWVKKEYYSGKKWKSSIQITLE